MHQWTWNVCHFGNLFTVNWHILSIGLFVFHWSLLSCPLVIDFCFLFSWPTWWSCGELEITGVCSRLWGQTSLPQWAAVLPRLHIQGLFFLLLCFLLRLACASSTTGNPNLHICRMIQQHIKQARARRRESEIQVLHLSQDFKPWPWTPILKFD